jgi:hypothetical protein
MLYVALAEAALLLAVIVMFAGLIRSLTRAHARREDLLLNQMCNLAGKPWQQPPATAENLDVWRQKLEDERAERRSWTTNPEQEI